MGNTAGCGRGGNHDNDGYEKQQFTMSSIADKSMPITQSNFLVKGELLFKKYRVHALGGRGTFGEVYFATDIENNEEVAVKVLPHDTFFGGAALESKLLGDIRGADLRGRCPIVRFHGGFRHKGLDCLVFERLGGDMLDVLKATQLSGISLAQIRRVARCILRSFVLLQQLEIVHCDVKPENILVSKGPGSFISIKDPAEEQRAMRAKLIDFGSARVSDESPETYMQSRFYRAPDVMLSLRITNAIDIWSLGCVLVELLCGEPLFPGHNVHEMLYLQELCNGPLPQEILRRASIMQLRQFFEPHDPETGKQISSTKVRQNPRMRVHWKLRKVKSRNLSRGASSAIKLGMEVPKRVRDSLERHGRADEESDKDIDTFVDLVTKMLDYNLDTRIRANEALHHPFLAKPVGRRSSRNLKAVDIPNQPQQASARVAAHEDASTGEGAGSGSAAARSAARSVESSLSAGDNDVRTNPLADIPPLSLPDSVESAAGQPPPQPGRSPQPDAPGAASAGSQHVPPPPAPSINRSQSGRSRAQSKARESGLSVRPPSVRSTRSARSRLSVDLADAGTLQGLFPDAALSPMRHELHSAADSDSVADSTVSVAGSMHAEDAALGILQLEPYQPGRQRRSLSLGPTSSASAIAARAVLASQTESRDDTATSEIDDVSGSSRTIGSLREHSQKRKSVKGLWPGVGMDRRNSLDGPPTDPQRYRLTHPDRAAHSDRHAHHHGFGGSPPDRRRAGLPPPYRRREVSPASGALTSPDTDAEYAVMATATAPTRVRLRPSPPAGLAGATVTARISRSPPPPALKLTRNWSASDLRQYATDIDAALSVPEAPVSSSSDRARAVPRHRSSSTTVGNSVTPDMWGHHRRPAMSPPRRPMSARGLSGPRFVSRSVTHDPRAHERSERMAIHHPLGRGSSASSARYRARVGADLLSRPPLPRTSSASSLNRMRGPASPREPVLGHHRSATTATPSTLRRATEL